MARVLRTDVHIETSPGVYTVLKAGEAVPAEFTERVTNPSAFVEVAAEQKPSAPAPAAAPPSASSNQTGDEPSKPVDYTKGFTKPQLLELAGQRGLTVATSTVKALAAALAAQDAEEAAKAAQGTGGGAEVDFDTLDEAALRAYAVEHNIEVDSGLTREEILAVIENELQGA